MRKRPDLYKYLRWRFDVMKRDGRKCKKCGNSTKKDLQVHHIKRYEQFPHLRNVVSNGITLCKKCHASMKGNEEGWEKFCHLLITDKKLMNEIGNLLRKEKLKDEANE